MNPKKFVIPLVLLVSSSSVWAQTAPAAAPEAPPPAPGEVVPGNQPGTVPPPKPPVSQTETSQVQPTTQPDTAKKVSWTDRVKLSGKAFLRYSYELYDKGANANQFALDRLYLQGEFMPSDFTRFQVTLDAGDTRNSQGNQVFFAETKYAFAEVKEFIPGLYARAGIIPLAWVPYEEDLWGYRVQGPIATDRWGYLTSADLGVAVGGTLPGKFGSFQLNLNNGEGYKGIEIAKRKELQARLTLTPLSSMGGVIGGLFVSGFGSYGFYDDAGLPHRNKSRAIGQIGVQSTPLLLAAEYFVGQDANAKVKGRFTVGSDDPVNSRGVSAFGVLYLGGLFPAINGVELLGRYDLIDPDTSLADNNDALFIGGVAYKWSTSFKSLVDYEAVTHGTAAHKPNESRIKLQAEYKF